LGCSRVNNFDNHTQESEAVLEVYDDIRRELLSMHPWHFALKQTLLYPKSGPHDPRPGPPQYPNPWAMNPDIKAPPGHPQQVPPYGPYANYGAQSDPFARIEYAGGGYRNRAASVPYNRDYHEHRFPLPADCLKIDEVDENFTHYRVEGRQILCHRDRLFIRYIADIEDPNIFDSTFVSAFTYRLAKELAWKLMGSAQMTDQMDGFYERALREARLKNAKEGHEHRGFEYTFLASRGSGYRGW
jgi:hypothetical protein